MVAESSTLVWFLPLSIVSLHLEGSPHNLLPRLIKGLLGLAKAVSQGKFSRLKQIICDSRQILDDHAVASMFSAAGAGVDFNVVDSFPLTNATLPTPVMEIRGPSYSPEPMPLPERDSDLGL